MTATCRKNLLYLLKHLEGVVQTRPGGLKKGGGGGRWGELLSAELSGCRSPACRVECGVCYKQGSARHVVPNPIGLDMHNQRHTRSLDAGIKLS